MPAGLKTEKNVQIFSSACFISVNAYAIFFLPWTGVPQDIGILVHSSLMKSRKMLSGDVGDTFSTHATASLIHDVTSIHSVKDAYTCFKVAVC